MHAQEQDVWGDRPRDDDYASLVSALAAELPRETIARVLQIRLRELDAIEAGVIPDEKVAARLRQLDELGEKAYLSDPISILHAFGWQGPTEASVPSLAEHGARFGRLRRIDRGRVAISRERG